LTAVNCGFCFQYVSEKIGGAKGTELEDDIIDMEKVSFHLQIIVCVDIDVCAFVNVIVSETFVRD